FIGFDGFVSRSDARRMCSERACRVLSTSRSGRRPYGCRSGRWSGWGSGSCHAFFDVHDGEHTVDDIGVELADADAAREQI
ncbi:MAG TPA: hypothetical protein VEY05_10005, partial [Beijerinckiaceae bacterium]|nr:hypothetical protein [Beijerinckiaceae bacterium]